jgi:hypothetical protein
MLQQLELEVQVRKWEIEIPCAHLEGWRAPHVRPDQPFDARDRFTPELHRGII